MAVPPPRPPNDFRDAVVALPDDFVPYGDDCPFGRDVQAVFHHHGVIQFEVDTLRHLGFHSIASFALANPDGDKEAKHCFKETLESFQSPLCRRRISLVFRRVLADDMFAALPRAAPAAPSLPPADPKEAPAAAAAVAAAATAAGDAGAASKWSSKRRRDSSSSSSDSDSSDVDESDGAGKSGGKKKKDLKDKASTKDAAAMMESLNCEVRLRP